MKTLIDQLAAGKIEYKRPEVELSRDKIEKEALPDTQVTGRLEISSVNHVPLKGVVYSTNSRIHVLHDQFSGLRTAVEYEVHTSDMDIQKGNSIQGFLILITNGGEFRIEVEIRVVERIITSSIGSIRNFFDFANLVQTNYDEALKLFMSDDFKVVLDRNDYQNQSLYDGLIRSVDKKMALEEFLIAINKKTPVTLGIEQTYREFGSLKESFQEVVNLTRDTWGYVNVSVKTYGQFLTDCRANITQDDFAGNKYEYSYLIDKDKLHRGINYGRIVFETYRQRLIYDIKITNNAQNLVKIRQAQDNIIRLTDKYLKYRMHKCSREEWTNKSLAFVERLLTTPQYADMALLYKAFLQLHQEKDDAAGWILEDFAKNRAKQIENQYELYCFYLYVRSLSKKDEDYTRQILKEITRIYERKCRSWKILLLTIYLDDKYQINQSLKYTIIKSEYTAGCRSPYMYLEALGVLNEQPGLLRILNPFEIQILRYGARNNWIDEKLIHVLVDLVMTEKRYDDSLYETLSMLYDLHPSDDLLAAICCLLIRGSKTDHRYFKWFEAGVNAELRIANIYEYYMFSIRDDDMKVLPRLVYMYFSYNSDALGARQSYLYANIISNKTKIRSIYENYKKKIEQYLIEQLFESNTDRNLNIIYEDILKNSLINGDVARNLPDIAQAYELTCDASQMREVVVLHKEVVGERVYRLRDGKATVQIYTEDPVIVFIDSYGRRFAGSVTWKLKKLSDMQEYLKLCFEGNQDNEFLLLHFAEQYIRYQDNQLDTIDRYKKLMTYPDIREQYKQDITNEIVDFYYRKYKGNRLEEYLKTVDKNQMSAQTRNKILEMMILRHMYPEVFELIRQYGYDGIDLRSLLRFTTRYIQVSRYHEDAMVLEIAYYLYSHGKYTESVLKYLNLYYCGTMEDMLRLWKDECNFVFEDHSLEERILIQTMFTDNLEAQISPVFDSYYHYGLVKNIKMAFYVFLCSHVLEYYHDKQFMKKHQYVFRYIERDASCHLELPEICRVTLLLYGASGVPISEEMIPVYKELLLYMSRYNVLLEEFKQYEKWFEIPFYLSDKVIVDYIGRPESRVFLSYSVDDSRGSTGLMVEEMQQVFPGIFVRNFVLFYGDRLEYYISEEHPEEEVKTTKKVTVEMKDQNIYQGTSRFNMLNRILVARDTGDSTQEQRCVEQYLEQDKVSKAVFISI